MKKILFAAAASLITLLSVIASVSAAPKNEKSKNVELFDGSFSGVMYGDQGSQAPLHIEMAQDGSLAIGTVELGRGLFVDGGRCGGGYVPAGIQPAQGVVNHRNIAAETNVKVGGFKIAIELEGVMSADGQSINAVAKIDLPWLCGRDPVVTAFVSKDS